MRKHLCGYLLATPLLCNLRSIAHTRLRLAHLTVCDRRRKYVLALEALKLLREVQDRIIRYTVNECKNHTMRHSNNNGWSLRW